MANLLSAQSRSFEIDSSPGGWVDLVGGVVFEVSTFDAFEGTHSLKATLPQFYTGFGLGVGFYTTDLPVAPGDILTLGANWLVPVGSALGTATLYSYIFDVSMGIVGLVTGPSAPEIEGGWNSLFGPGDIPVPAGGAYASLIWINVLPGAVPAGEEEVRYLDYMTFDPAVGVSAGIDIKPLRQRQQDHDIRQRQRAAR